MPVRDTSLLGDIPPAKADVCSAAMSEWGGRLVRRKATVAVLAAILVGSVATTAGALPAGSSGPSPKLVILEAVFLHNAADKTMLTIALQLQQSYSDCVDQQQQPDPIWSGVEGDG